MTCTDEWGLMIQVKQIYNQIHELDECHYLRTANLRRRCRGGGRDGSRVRGGDSAGGDCNSGFKIKSLIAELFADLESELNFE